MAGHENKNESIRWGQFKNKSLEREYYNAEFARKFHDNIAVIFLASFIYFLFIIPEYFIIQNSRDFLLVLTCRSSVVLLLFILYIRFKLAKDYFKLIYWVAAYEVIIAISFIYISSKFEPPNFLIQSFGLMVIILGTFLVNNQWLYTNFIAIFIASGYSIFAFIYFEDLLFSDFLAGLIHIALVIFLTSISSLRINNYRRMQYLSNKELLRMAQTDALTGIYNKDTFNKEYARLADQALKNNQKLAVVIFDIDKFKEINDQFGHLTGDDVLVSLTARVQKNIKERDIFARWGGEEFVVIFPDEDLKGATICAERLRKVIADQPFDKAGHISCSFGVASFKGESDSNVILKRADDRLYQAKNSGRNKVM